MTKEQIVKLAIEAINTEIGVMSERIIKHKGNQALANNAVKCIAHVATHKAHLLEVHEL